jgi:hypothetical protein
MPLAIAVADIDAGAIERWIDPGCVDDDNVAKGCRQFLYAYQRAGFWHCIVWIAVRADMRPRSRDL